MEIKMKDYYRSYKDWVDFLGTKTYKKVCHQTNVRLNYNLSIGISYWNTNFVTIYPSGNIELNSSGYRTVTTKSRLNQFTPYRVVIFQKDYVWYIVDSYGDMTEFVDGIKLDSKGYFI